MIKSDQPSYSFQIFVEDEMHVWVVTLVPSLKHVREEGGAEQQVVHKVVSEFVQTSGKLEEIYQSMEVIVRYNDIFRISGHVDHLLVQCNPLINLLFNNFVSSLTLEVSSVFGWSK